ncbi:hypothetical protein EDI_135470 [Entamoeba dispar SAW760]|uniref:CCR4-not transcription complex n=1 Tax=Entamoeba dispar (strain ATCC PRA-260 / SAW760) TaxID=370354 RepID=B0EEH9_ENTDS|nr:uncharacterized protein EDI_135470 [Entamoeba dispar SAW760]EDR27093.1 hypothetical protein EDI_135470 [Entamoeba dispar SAW760]|eukprot:EDR27093.1 hypothetical protein EDI_135470 [Entamoeba dispar SAW760]
MDSCLVQIKQIVCSTPKKNGKQNQSEINDILTMTGITGKVTYVKLLIESVLSDGIGRESFKLQTLRDEINTITQSSQAVLFKKELTAMKLSNTQVKSFRLNPSGEYLFGILPNQPTSLTSALLFDYLCEHPEERIDRTNASNANIFSISWKTPISLDLSLPLIHTISKEIVGELGTSCVGSKDTFSALLSNIYGESMTEQQVGELIVLLIQCIERSTNDSSTVSEWDAEIIGTVLKPKCKNWSIIAKVMDLQGYEYKSLNAIILLIRIFQQIGDFPFNSFFKEEWNNGRAQGCVVQKLIHIASQSTSESQYLMKYICSLYNVGVERGIRVLWEQQGFVEQIIAIGERASSDFDSIYSSIEVVLPILCKCKASAGRQRAVLALLRNNTKQYAVVQSLWKNNSLIIAQGLRDRYMEDPSSIDDIINSIGIQECAKVLTQMRPTSFALDIACLLVKKDGFILDKWLIEQRKLRGSVFGKEIIQFIKDKQLLANGVSPFKLDLEIVKQLLGTASSCGSRKEANELEQQFYTKTPKKETIPGRANEIFGDYFKGNYTVEAIVNVIIKMRDSQETSDNDLFAFFIKTLFDEFKRISDFLKVDVVIQFGNLYGEIISKGVLKNCALIHILRVILWALREPISSNFFTCGLNALIRFKNRLHEWPTYCYLLKEIKSIETQDPQLYRTICENANSKFAIVLTLIQKLYPRVYPQIMLDSKSVSVIRSLCGCFEDISSMSIEQIKKESQNLLNTFKSTQTNEMIETSLFMIAITRESTQPKCIDIIQSFGFSLDNLNSFTIEMINILLKRREYDKQTASLFESLGSLLGLLTIGMNKPLRSNKLVPKSLLTDQLTIENFDVMLEFVVHFLFSSNKSDIFTPNNPWIVPLLQVVCEVSLSPELMIHHSSIEKLLQSLHISAKDYLECHPLRSSAEDSIDKLRKFAKDRNNGDEGIFYEFVENKQLIPEKTLKQVLLSEKSLCYVESLKSIPNIQLPECLICPSLSLDQWYIIIVCFLDFSLQDISKTTTVSMNAIITTVIQLVQKDFAMETDINKISEATNRVFNIAQKLSQYTCRSCLDTKLWKYITPYVNIAVKQKEISKPIEQMKEIVMNSLQPQIEKAVSIKLEELKKSAKRQLEQFILQITPERQAAISSNNNKFVAKGFEYLNDAPQLPPKLQIAYGGVTNYQMETYALGVTNETKQHLDDKLVNFVHQPLRFDTIEKYVQLLTPECTEKTISKLITQCINKENKDYCIRTMEIIGIIFINNKKQPNRCCELLSEIFNEVCSIFEKNYNTSSFNPEIYATTLSSLIEMLIEKSLNVIDTILLMDHFITFFQKLHPRQFPKFTCQWIELFSHRSLLLSLSKPSEKKNTVLSMYFDLFMKYLQFVQPILTLKVHISKQIYSATLISILTLRECFPTFLSFFALPLVSAIPYTAVSLRLPILTVVSHEDNYSDHFETLKGKIPLEIQKVLKKGDILSMLPLIKTPSALPIVVELFTKNSLNLLEGLLKLCTEPQRIEIINAVVDLMRLQTETTQVMKDFISKLISLNIENLNEIILRVLIERSFGEYHQVGAMKALESLVQKHPQLIYLAKRKSTIVAQRLSELC